MNERTERQRKMCDGKVKHGSYFPALIGARMTGKLATGGEGTSVGLVPYKCDFCHGWHVGHQPLKNLRRVES